MVSADLGIGRDFRSRRPRDHPRVEHLLLVGPMLRGILGVRPKSGHWRAGSHPRPAPGRGWRRRRNDLVLSAHLIASAFVCRALARATTAGRLSLRPRYVEAAEASADDMAHVRCATSGVSRPSARSFARRWLRAGFGEASVHAQQFVRCADSNGQVSTRHSAALTRPPGASISV